MSQVFYRNAGAPRQATHASGIYIYDESGKAYLDASGGAAVSCLGHDDPRVIKAIKDQLDKLPYAHTSFFTSEPAESLASYLCEQAPGDFGKAYFVSGGSEAMEAALKLARQFHLENGEPERCRFIARQQSYHGNTLGALAVGGNYLRREPFEPLLTRAHHISACYPYRGQETGESLEAYGLRVADELEYKLLELGPETVCAFIAETVVGATAGALAPAPGYFKRIREICNRYGVLLILDEVMCGMGRTGTLFAYEQEDVYPDIVTIAKGLGAGYQPIGAMLATNAIHETISSGSGSFQHGHTYLGHCTACAGSLAVQRVIRDDDLLSNVRERGTKLGQLLQARFGQHLHVGDIRGRGLFWAIEFVAERETQTPFDPEQRRHAALKAAAMDEGLMCYPMGGCVDGTRGDHVLLAPAYICTDDDLAEIVTRLERAIRRVF